LKALINKGIPRFKAYRDVQRVAFESYDKEIEYIDAISMDKSISSHLSKQEIKTIFTPENHLGASSTIITNVSNSVQKTCKKFI